MRVLVTGGAGFIGVNLVHALSASHIPVVTLDALTYAAASESVRLLQALPNHDLVSVSICDRDAVTEVLEQFRPTVVINLAAATHVDRSIDDPSDFVETNIQGVFSLLEAVRTYLSTLPQAERDAFRLLHVSTDEVYGSLDDGLFDENSLHRPSSPYAASKAAAEDLVRAWHVTYGLPVIVTNCTNNYGPFQFPEKLIPHMILRALHNMPLPVYGDGSQCRDWLHVSDHVAALRAICEHGQPGRAYNVAGGNTPTNIEIVRTVCELLDDCRPRADGRPHAVSIQHVEDRPGHDRRYALDATRLEREIGFVPRTRLRQGLAQTVRWYVENEKWWRFLTKGDYKLERLGTGDTKDDA